MIFPAVALKSGKRASNPPNRGDEQEDAILEAGLALLLPAATIHVFGKRRITETRIVVRHAIITHLQRGRLPMSRSSAASHAAAEPPIAPRIRRLPAWTRRRNPYCAIPEVFFTHVAPEVSPAALQTLGYMVFLAGEEEFVSAAQDMLAKKLKMHVNTVQACLDELERAGAIAVRKQGKRNVYDLLVDEWRKVKCRPRPKDEEIAEAAAEDAAEAPAADVPRKPLQSMRLKMGESRAIKLPPTVTCRTVRCENHSNFPIDIEARYVEQPGEDSLLELAISEKANIDKSFVENAAVNQMIPSETAGYQELRQMLNRALGAHLGFVPEDDLRAIGNALDRCPIDHLARRLHQRRSMFTGGKGTWGGVLLLARDCAKAFAAASTPAPAPAPQPEPLLAATAEDEAAYNAHCDRLVETWWVEQTSDEQAKLNDRHRDAVYKQYAGTRYWPKAQLAETIRGSIRAEALKTLAPTFEDFLRRGRAMAKGAGA